MSYIREKGVPECTCPMRPRSIGEHEPTCPTAIWRRSMEAGPELLEALEAVLGGYDEQGTCKDCGGARRKHYVLARRKHYVLHLQTCKVEHAEDTARELVERVRGTR